MGSMIEFDCPNGERCPGYFAEPSRAGAPGLVVIQEWWGLNDQMKRTADRFAEAGFAALVPDLYRGELTTDAEEAGHKMNHLDWPNALHRDLRGAALHLKGQGRSVGVLGFCMGGALTIAAAVHLEEMSAGVCFYGIPPREFADPAKIRVPLLAHFASEDDWCTPEAQDALEARMTEGNVNYELHRYQGLQHAFFNEARPEVYDAEGAQLAWQRSLDFLRARL